MPTKPRKSKISYATLTLEQLKKNFGLQIIQDRLFPRLDSIQLEPWMSNVLQNGFNVSLVSEKARSEFIIAPILLYMRALCQNRFNIYSGVHFDIAPERGLHGICDFIIGRSPSVPIVQAPVLMMVEAKKQDIELGLGQCAAEMIAAQIFNQAEKNDIGTLYGCVTTGESWQFMRLVETTLAIDDQRYFFDNIPAILGILKFIVDPNNEILQSN